MVKKTPSLALSNLSNLNILFSAGFNFSLSYVYIPVKWMSLLD